MHINRTALSTGHIFQPTAFAALHTVSVAQPMHRISAERRYISLWAPLRVSLQWADHPTESTLVLLITSRWVAMRSCRPVWAQGPLWLRTDDGTKFAKQAQRIFVLLEGFGMTGLPFLIICAMTFEENTEGKCAARQRNLLRFEVDLLPSVWCVKAEVANWWTVLFFPPAVKHGIRRNSEWCRHRCSPRSLPR